MSRKDYVNDLNAPNPNSLVPAVAVAVLEDERILLVKRKDNLSWAIPGGKIELGESVVSAAVREMKEETGLDISVKGLIGVYSNPGNVIAYSNGEVRQQFALLVKGGIVRNTPLAIDDESVDIRFFRKEETEKLKLSPGQKDRILDAFSHVGSGVIR